jgi:hypothetical protein
MAPQLVWIISSFMMLGILAGASTTSLAKPKTPLAQVKCDCTCEKTYEGGGGEVITSTLGNKVFAAPGGDPNRCGGMNGTTCRTSAGEGKLNKCSAVVEHKLPDLRPGGTGEDLKTKQ